MRKFYHVDRAKGRFRPNQVISLLHDKSSVDFKTDRARFYSSLFPEGVSYHGWNYLLNVDRPRPGRDTSGVIEMLAEQIRAASYPGRISRFQSFFVFKTISDAHRFIDLFPATLPDGSKSKQGEIWEIAGDNVEFESDMHRLNLGSCWLDAMINLHAYWQGKFTKSPLREILLRPPVMVIRKINGLTLEENHNSSKPPY